MRTMVYLLLALTYNMNLVAQTSVKSTRLEYDAACNDAVSFGIDKARLDKVDSELCVSTSRGNLIYKDTLAEEEHPNMRRYDAIGVNADLNWALIEETRLTETKYIIVNLDTKNTKYFNSRPIVSSDGKYVITITEPQGDQYLGLEIYERHLDAFECVFRDSRVKHLYDFESGKWCNRRFYVIRRGMVNHEEDYISFVF